MAKRAASEDLVVPEGFKDWNGRLVVAKYPSLRLGIPLSKVPIQSVWFDSMEDDQDDKKRNADSMKVLLDDIEDKEVREFIEDIDRALADAAKQQNLTHCPLVVEGKLKLKFTSTDKNGKVAKMTKAKKTRMTQHPHCVSGTFLASSVYTFKADNECVYYGLNFIGNYKNSPKVVIQQQIKPKTDAEDYPETQPE
tara:strand:- start:660 stop:1244 length:585 start_codon:yes stop_codon:yes gene_type:complete